MLTKRIVWRLLFVVCTLGALAGPKPAHACSCDAFSPPEVAFAEADAVFMGTAVKAFDLQQLGIPNHSGMQYTFAVETSWKGVTTTQALVYTGYDDADCGISFTVGQPYLVYAHQHSNGDLGTSFCDRTMSHKTMARTDDLAYLVTQPTLIPPPPPPDFSFMPWLGLCAGVFVVVLLGLGGGFWAIRRRRTLRSL